MSDVQQVCSFFLNHMLFGVEVTSVQEVNRALDVTPVPLAPELVWGLANLRGQIVTAINVKRRLLLPELEGEDPASMNVVIRASCGPVSLLVDEIHGVIDVNRADFEPAPENLEADVREVIRGAYKLDERLMMLLDVERLVDFGETPEELS